LNKYLSFLKKLLKNEKFEVQKHILKILVKFLKFNKNKEDILKYTEKDLLKSISYYDRRLYLVFFEHCLDRISMDLIKECGILDNYFSLLNDNNFILLKIIQTLPIFYFFVADHTSIKFIVMTKLGNLNKTSKDLEIKRVNIIFIKY
jgi:hypothetical protein